jgi:hypothetical protein
MEKWNNARQQTGNHRNAQDRSNDREVHADFRGARDSIKADGLQGAKDSVSRSKTARAARHREQQTFDYELSRKLRAGGAEREPRGKLPQAKVRSG